MHRLRGVVAAGHGVSLGSYEYLVYEKVFVAVAAEFGLHPVTDYVAEDTTMEYKYHEHRQLYDLLEQVRRQCWLLLTRKVTQNVDDPRPSSQMSCMMHW